MLSLICVLVVLWAYCRNIALLRWDTKTNPCLMTIGYYQMGLGWGSVLGSFCRAVVALAAHMVIVCSPLLLVPQMAWQRWFIPTIEGQYIIKNLALLSLALALVNQRVKPTPEPE